MVTTRILNFLSLMMTHPRDAFDRLEGIVDLRWERLLPRPFQYDACEFNALLGSLEKATGYPLSQFLEEPAFLQIEEQVQAELSALPQDAPFPAFMNGDLTLARLCYVLSRAHQPMHVVETGVCYGVTTAFVLQAIKENGRGWLHSVDLPPLGKQADQFIGKVVPARLRSRWQFHRGSSKHLLHRLLTEIGSVGLFVHDSLHTYRNIRRELELITKFLSPGALVICDDIEGNPAFHEWIDKVRPGYWQTLKQQNKSSLVGVAAFLDAKSRDLQPDCEATAQA